MTKLKATNFKGIILFTSSKKYVVVSYRLNNFLYHIFKWDYVPLEPINNHDDWRLPSTKRTLW